MTRGPDLALERLSPAPVCGVDEAGRGPWAGPVCAAAVILAPGDMIAGLDDSKKLPAGERERLAALIQTRALAWSVAALDPSPAFALVDGAYAFDLPCSVRMVVGGDGLCASIAAASIIAKTIRDRLMVSLDWAYPGYGFARHKGYGVAAHAEALTRLGPCAAHRMTFAPLRRLMTFGPENVQVDPLDQD